LGSEIRDPEKTYSGSRIQGSKRHRIPDPDPQHCVNGFKLMPAIFEAIVAIFKKKFITVSDPDPGSGIGFFRIPDPKLIFLRA
jgi:hypothetical protein